VGGVWSAAPGWCRASISGALEGGAGVEGGEFGGLLELHAAATQAIANAIRWVLPRVPAMSAIVRSISCFARLT
jgi:hypothetical protein